jgi:hypothetical protein
MLLRQEAAMKRLHVHISVDDLGQSRRFYSTLFAAEPTVVKDDYVKWMLDDPRVNFAISTRPGRAAGISHLGIQAEDKTELAEVFDRLSRAERPIVEAKNATCCYAQSDKQWIADPQGVPWDRRRSAPALGAIECYLTTSVALRIVVGFVLANYSRHHFGRSLIRLRPDAS